MVWHPKPRWVDPATGERVRPPRSDRERARLDQHMSFGVGYVFDAASTDGDPLPELGHPAPETAPTELTDHLEQYCQNNGVAVEVGPLRSGLAGYYQREGDRIVLSRSRSEGERTATLAHELAHREDPELIAASRQYVDPRLVDLQEGADIYWTVEMSAMKERGEVSEDFEQEDMFGFDLVD